MFSVSTIANGLPTVVSFDGPYPTPSRTTARFVVAVPLENRGEYFLGNTHLVEWQGVSADAFTNDPSKIPSVVP